LLPEMKMLSLPSISGEDTSRML